MGRQTERLDRPACPPDRWTAKRENRLTGRKTGCQADRRNVRQTDGPPGRQTECQADRRNARQTDGWIVRTHRLLGRHTRTVGKTDGLHEDLPGRRTDCRSGSCIVSKTDGLPGRHADCLTGRRPPASRQTDRQADMDDKASR
jgi:hypothetical protein